MGKHVWPLPLSWVKSHYTIDFYPEGARLFDKEGNQISHKEALNRFADETGEEHFRPLKK